MLIDATHAEETRVVVMEDNRVEEFDFESGNKRQAVGNIYLAKVVQIEPSIQAAFVDYGAERQGFLAFSEIHPEYYRVPEADRQPLMETAPDGAPPAAAAQEGRRRVRRSRDRAPQAAGKSSPPPSGEASTNRAPPGMETIDLAPEAEKACFPLEAHQPEQDALFSHTSGRAAGAPTAPLPSGVGEESDPEPAPNPRAKSRTAVACSHADAEAVQVASVPADNGPDETPDEATETPPPRSRAHRRRYHIQDVIKVGQNLLLQVAKEERGTKRAALTSYLSLAGRYCVLLPNTADSSGISRKITSTAQREKLKQILDDMKVPRGAGLILRTTGAQCTKADIRRDYEYLRRLWEKIRDLTLKSTVPATIHEESNLIQRSIRDRYDRETEQILVEGEAGYRSAKEFMKMIMPSHSRHITHYQEALPLFAQYGVEGFLDGLFNPTVPLKSGGNIVIGMTEALVAIDVNSGRSTRAGSIEVTALKTNLEAADEVARQLRLRDLAGLIVIDFIDMEERKNISEVEQRLKERLKADRARLRVGRISEFGLLEMTRQRMRPGMVETITQKCPQCHGTGLLRSDSNMALAILRDIKSVGAEGRVAEVLVRAPVAIANYLMNRKRAQIIAIEQHYDMSVVIEGDATLATPHFVLEKTKRAVRTPRPEADAVITAQATLMGEEPTTEALPADAPARSSDASLPKEPSKRPARGRQTRRAKGTRGAARKAKPNSPEESGRAESVENSENIPAESAASAEDVSAEPPPSALQPRRQGWRAAPSADSTDSADTEPARPGQSTETMPAAQVPAAGEALAQGSTAPAEEGRAPAEPSPPASQPRRQGWWVKRSANSADSADKDPAKPGQNAETMPAAQTLAAGEALAQGSTTPAEEGRAPAEALPPAPQPRRQDRGAEPSADSADSADTEPAKPRQSAETMPATQPPTAGEALAQGSTNPAEEGLAPAEALPPAPQPRRQGWWAEPSADSTDSADTDTAKPGQNAETMPAAQASAAGEALAQGSTTPAEEGLAPAEALPPAPQPRRQGRGAEPSADSTDSADTDPAKPGQNAETMPAAQPPTAGEALAQGSTTPAEEGLAPAEALPPAPQPRRQDRGAEPSADSTDSADTGPAKPKQSDETMPAAQTPTAGEALAPTEPSPPTPHPQQGEPKQ